jgi:hypothetical protein
MQPRVIQRLAYHLLPPQINEMMGFLSTMWWQWFLDEFLRTMKKGEFGKRV